MKLKMVRIENLNLVMSTYIASSFVNSMRFTEKPLILLVNSSVPNKLNFYHFSDYCNNPKKISMQKEGISRWPMILTTILLQAFIVFFLLSNSSFQLTSCLINKCFA